MSSVRARKTWSRSIEGLRDALFDELEDLRSGASSPHEAVAFSTLSEVVLATFDKEMKKAAFDMAIKERAVQLEERRVALLEHKPAPNHHLEDAEEMLDRIDQLSVHES